MKWLFVIISVVIIGCKGTGSKKIDEDFPTVAANTPCIERILEQDSILGDVRNHTPENASLSEAIINYTRDLKSLDYSNCPEAFTDAFQKHIDAWKKVTIITDKYPGLRGELHDIFSELEKSKDSTEFKALVKEVWDTWAPVEAFKK